jgi:folate-binding protein YgfZ
MAAHRYQPACVLWVEGHDAATFLQGQFSNDLGGLEPGGGAYGLWLDRRGRVVADSHVVRAAGGAGYWVASVSSPAADVMRRLGDFIIADDVTLEDRTAGWRALALVGDGAGAWLGEQPRDGLVLRGRRSARESWEWMLPGTALAGAEAAVAGARPLQWEELEGMRIDAGLASVPRDIGPGDLPNEGGLEAATVSYSKGCYLGQEVMARLRGRGTVRRALVRVGGRGAPPPLPAALWRGGQASGELRSAVAAGAGGYRGLAIVPVGSAAPGTALGLEKGGPATLEVAAGP